jgi:hypothetical protein
VNCRCNACDLNLGSLERKTHESIPFVPDTIRSIPCPTWEKYGSSDLTVIAQVLCCKLVAVLSQFCGSFVAAHPIPLLLLYYYTSPIMICRATRTYLTY